MAQACLQVLNNINDRLIMGGKVHDSLGLTDSNGVNLNGPDQQVCYLARTNLKLFMKSVQVLGCDVQRSSQKPLPKISFVGVRIRSKTLFNFSLIFYSISFN